MESQKTEKSRTPRTAEKQPMSDNRNLSSSEPNDREELAENFASAESSLEKPVDHKPKK